MIRDNIRNRETYFCFPLFEKAFRFLETLTESTPDGTYELDGKNLFAMVQSGDTSAEMPDKLEAHRKYIDIQFLISGEEKLLYAENDGSMEIHTPYHPEIEAEFLKISPENPPSEMILKPGDFAVFFPQDAHYGRIAGPKGAAFLKKAVIKAAAAE